MVDEVDVLCLQIVDLQVLGDDFGCLHDERDDQHGADHKLAPRSARRFVYAAHITPHAG
ncbi:hypothetical protein ACGFYV_21160 [Streptomyces sp. NPDC048297]|uniref:hypothetical protein n=1 Tax=Streptomyces sp. NPDC048297 TaxID=3365531 RepID=UPI0037240E16